MNEFTLKNRKAHQRDRDIAYQNALNEFKFIEQNFDNLIGYKQGKETLLDKITRLTYFLDEAKEHAIRAKGNDTEFMFEFVSTTELVYLDYLKSLYAAAKNIKSLLKHNLMLQKYEEERKIQDKNLKTYIENSRKIDENLIKQHIQIFARRMENFNRSISIGTI